MNRCLLPLLINTLLLAQTPAEMPAPQQPAAIEGDVVDNTGQPVPWARVEVRGMSTAHATADAGGHFSLTGLRPTRLPLTANRRGFMQKIQTVTLAPGQILANLRVQMAPQAVIAGRIEDQDGWPDYGAHVQALVYVYQNGARRLFTVATADANDLGEYRLAKLPAGRYYVRAAPSWRLTNFDEQYAPGYYRGAPDPAGENQVEVHAGQELTGVNIRLPKRDGVRVEGRVVWEGGTRQGQMTWAWVSLQTGDSLPGSEIRASLMKGDGTFVVRSVPPGTYVLKAQIQGSGPDSGVPKFLAVQKLEVGGSDIAGIVLDLHPVVPQDVAGTIVFEGDARPGPVRVSLQPEGRSTLGTTSAADGTFVLRGLFPGRYRLRAYSVPASPSERSQPGRFATLKSARLGDADVTITEFEIGSEPVAPLRLTMARAVVGRLQGVVLDSARQPVSGAVVVLAPAGSPPRETVTVGLTDQDGRFTGSAPAGVYRVFPWAEPIPYLAMQDPDVLKAHEKELRTLTLIEGVNPPLTLVLP